MKKILKITGWVFLTLIVVVIAGISVVFIRASMASSDNMSRLNEPVKTLESNGIRFRDLNHNGRLDIYENPDAPLEQRVQNLIGQMTLEEKAGAMFITMIGTTQEGDLMEGPAISSNPLIMFFSFILPANSHMVVNQHMSNFNILASLDNRLLARYNNRLQALAERTRLGIPVTIATDPRHGTSNNPGAGIFTPQFSKWPSPLGLAATRDSALVRTFGDIARQEYRATGITLALHPMADLATEPRWARINGTFGEDADLSALLTRAYVLGFQGDSLGNKSVACMTKHFSGGGPQLKGEDPHFPYGKEQVYPAGMFNYHLIPFIKGAFPARTAQIMPYYGIPMNQTNENVAFAFNKAIITGLLRDSLRFEGVVCTDWNIITDTPIGEGRAWGVEHLSPIERVKKVIDAGCDQFGGENVPELVVQLVHSGALPESRINVSVARILRDKFRLGLFDDPYVDEDAAEAIANNFEFKAIGEQAQERSTVLLKNDGLLPLKKGIKIFTVGFEDKTSLGKYGEAVDNSEAADVVLIRVNTPFDPRNDNFLESFFHQGRLYYTEEELQPVLDLAAKKPVVVLANLERPAILTELNLASRALLAEFGATDAVLLDIVFGIRQPSGLMPFELPSSWEAVQKQLEDKPRDSQNPLFPYGFGLRYEAQELIELR